MGTIVDTFKSGYLVYLIDRLSAQNEQIVTSAVCTVSTSR